MAGHRVRLQQGHAINHVLAAGLQRRPRTLPGIAAIEQHDLVAALGTDGVDDSRRPIQTADTTIGLGESLEILRGQSVGRRRPGRDPEAGEKLLAGDMRRLAARLSDAEIDRRLAEIERHQLAMNIGHVNQRDVAERLEGQQFLFRQLLLREGP